MIRIWDVNKSYGGHAAVTSLTLDVMPGEIFAFLGANGAGKTTTIKMLVGLLLPDTGSITIGDVDVTQSPRAASRMIGYVPDQPYVYDKLTGREFLEFVANLYGLSNTETNARIQQQVDLFNLSAFVDRLAETYSHGMKQRLVFAAAMIHCPEVVVLDEPMVGLDPHSMRVVKDLIYRRASAGAAIFMSTHTLPLAEEMATRIGVIHGGRLQFVGTVDDLRTAQRSSDETLERLFLNLTNSPE